MGNWQPGPARPIPFEDAEEALTAELLTLIRLARRLHAGLAGDESVATPTESLLWIATTLEDRLVWLEVEVDHLSEQVAGSPVYPQPDYVPLFRGSSTDGAAELNMEGRAALSARLADEEGEEPQLPVFAEVDYSAPGHHCRTCGREWSPEEAPFGGTCPVCPGGPAVEDGRRVNWM